MQVITDKIELIKNLRDNGYAVSEIEIKGYDNSSEKYMLFIEIDKNNFSDLQKLIKKYDKKAFLVVNETKYVQNGYLRK